MSEHFTRRCAAVIVDIDLDRLPAWEPGPLPFRQGDTVASGEVRRTYFNERAGQALYGPNRVHRWASPGRIAAPPAGLEVLGLELLRVHERRHTRNALLAVHGNLLTDRLELIDSLAKLAQVDPAVSTSRRWYDELLEGAGRVEGTVRRAATATLVTPAGRSPTAPLPSPTYEHWSPELQWLWLLASSTPPEEYQPPPEYADRLPESVVSLSAGWLALVLRDGVALLGSGADIGAFYRLSPDVELHFRAIYLDSLLLGHIQRLRLSQIADDLAALGDPVDHPERLVELEQELTEFRNVFWWQHLGPHWHGNELLRAYQRQHEIPELFAQVVEGLEDYSRQARTASSQQTSALLGVLTIVGLPFGLAVGLMRGISDWRWIVVALAAASAITAVILATPTGRSLVRPWFVGRRRR